MKLADKLKKKRVLLPLAALIGALGGPKVEAVVQIAAALL